jgi:hypothetical protein
MALSQQEIFDRLEIQDLIYNYSAIIDQKRFDDLRDVFTEDAHIDYSAFGAPVGGRDTATTSPENGSRRTCSQLGAPSPRLHTSTHG